MGCGLSKATLVMLKFTDDFNFFLQHRQQGYTE